MSADIQALTALATSLNASRNGDETHAEPHRADSWYPKDLIMVGAEPPQPPTLVQTPQGEGVLYRGVTHMLSGEPEALKSWVALIAAREEIQAGHNVLWIDTDGAGPGDTLDRLKALGLDAHQITHQFGYIEPDEPVTRDQLIELNGMWHPTLVVIDSLNPAMVLHGMDPNGETDVERFRRLMLGCWDGATELLLDHVAKDKEKRGGYSIGSQRKQALVKVHIQMEVVDRLSRDSTGVARMSATKDRPGWHHRGPGGRIGELTITPNAGTVSYAVNLTRLSGKSGGFRPTALMEKASEAIAAAGCPVTKQDLSTKVKGRAAFLQQAVDLLVEEGYVRRTLGSRGAQLHTTIKPYFEGQDEKRNQPLPTSSHVFREDVSDHGMTSSPPYRGEGVFREEVGTTTNTRPLPREEEEDYGGI